MRPASLASTIERGRGHDVFGFQGREGDGGTETGWGIGAAGAGIVVHGNRVGTSPGSGPTVGVAVLDGQVLVTDNRITGVETGVFLFAGSASCVSNVFFDVSTPLACGP
jgi:hypothetical protein